MPFYEYQCAKCGHHEEVLQSINEKPLTKCPNCGKQGLRKLISAPVFRLKGSGWYETDFKSDKENKRNLAGADRDEPKESKADTKADGKTDAKADAKADAKPDAKPETKGESKRESAKPAPVKSASRTTKAKSKSARKRR
jgi:putative FmdB family regulatory protein